MWINSNGGGEGGGASLNTSDLLLEVTSFTRSTQHTLAHPITSYKMIVVKTKFECVAITTIPTSAISYSDMVSVSEMWVGPSGFIQGATLRFYFVDANHFMIGDYNNTNDTVAPHLLQVWGVR